MHAQNTTAVVAERYIRLKEVCLITAASQATIWRWVKTNPGFPRPIRLSPSCTVWNEAELLEWIENKKDQRGDAQ